MGHVQDTPVLTKMILNECMMYHMKVHIFSYNLGPKIFSKSKIHILPIYGQTDSKPAIGVHRGGKGPFNTFSKNILSKRVSVD